MLYAYQDVCGDVDYAVEKKERIYCSKGFEASAVS
jgi:hypothetical protein